MSRKHDEAIARAFRETMAEHEDARAALVRLAQRIADALGADNPAFDRFRFMSGAFEQMAVPQE